MIELLARDGWKRYIMFEAGWQSFTTGKEKKIEQELFPRVNNIG